MPPPEGAVTSPASRGLCELVLIVRNVDVAARFYREVVGLIPEHEPADDWAWFWAGSPGEKQRIALHKGPLLFGEHSPHPPDRRWGHVHFALHIPRGRVEAALEVVQNAGVEVHGPVEFAWMNARSWYFYDPDGNLVEYWSPND